MTSAPTAERDAILQAIKGTYSGARLVSMLRDEVPIGAFQSALVGCVLAARAALQAQSAISEGELFESWRGSQETGFADAGDKDRDWRVWCGARSLDGARTAQPASVDAMPPRYYCATYRCAGDCGLPHTQEEFIAQTQEARIQALQAENDKLRAERRAAIVVIDAARNAMDGSEDAIDSIFVPSHLAATLSLALDDFDRGAARAATGDTHG